MGPELALLGLVCVASAGGLARLPALHPMNLLLVPWAIALALFVLRLLPYRSLSLTTVLVLAVTLSAFCVGGVVGSRRRVSRAQSVATRSLDSRFRLAAAGALCFALLGLGAFLLQVAQTFGPRAALIADPDVRAEVASGVTSLTIKYIYVAFAAAALCGVAAARSASPQERRRWFLAAAAAVALQYFSTGRSNLLLGGIIALVAYGSATTLSRRWLLLGAAAVSLTALVSFVAVGSLLGKTFSNSDIATYENTFMEHPGLRGGALPYQYLSAPVSALNEIVRVTPTWGRAGGCATLGPVCRAGQAAGLPLVPEPSLTPYTAEPSPWNTFTAMYAPLVDYGPWLAPLVFLLLGIGFGALWAAARTSDLALLFYACLSPGLLYSTVANSLLRPHLIGAGIIAALCLGVTPWLLRFRARRPATAG